MAERPTVYVCRGDRCRKHHDKDVKVLFRGLEPVACLEETRCQKVCDGPLLGTEIDGTLEWFCRMDSAKAVTNLVEVIAGGKLRKPLKKRRVEERSGRLR